LVIIATLIVCGFVASFLSRWFLQGRLDLSRAQTRVLLLVALAAVCYVNSFGNAFVWDDTTLIVENPTIRNWNGWLGAFTSDLYSNPITQTFYYRPLQHLSYRLDYSLWGPYPDGYHLLNIILHTASAILVLLLVRHFSQSATLGFTCGALWVVHPIHTQAVTYISGRADPMCAFFLLLTLWLYVKSRELPNANSHLCLGLAALAFAGALGAKEFAMFFPLLLVALELCLPRSDSPRSPLHALLRLLPFITLVLVCVLVRRSIFGSAWAPPPGMATEFAPLTLCMRALAAYVSLLLLPINLHMEQTVAFAGWKGTQLTVTGWFAAAAILSLIVLYWKRSRPVCFGLLWFMLFFLPVSNLWPLNATLAEHWMYFPSIGFIWAACAIVADLLRNWTPTAERAAQIGAAAAVFVVLLFAGRTILRNADWRDEITFYVRTIVAGGGTARVHNNLGKALVRERNDVESAEKEYKEALKLDPKYDAALNNLGLLHMQQREFDKAIPLFQQALTANPSRIEAYMNLAASYADSGRTNDAVRTFDDAVSRFPQSAALAFRHGMFAMRRGDLDVAEKELRRGLEINPYTADFANALGALAVEQNKPDDAVAWLRRAKQLDRFNTNPYVNLAFLYTKQAKYAEAERELLGALDLESHNPELHYRLGVLYWRVGQTNEAKRELNETLRLVPDFATAKDSLEKIEAGIPYGSTTGTLTSLKPQQHAPQRTKPSE
jgi:tetratricopeptide (TPR) repeat protein